MNIEIKTRDDIPNAELAPLFKALADPNRLAIFRAIRARCCLPMSEAEPGCCVSEIAEPFSLSLSTVSHHIKELKHAGLITSEKRGQWVYCAADEAALEKIGMFLSEA